MKIFMSALVLLALAAPASGQEQRASIEGTIRDKSGSVLRDVVIEARSPSLAGVETTVIGRAGCLPVSGAAAGPL